MRSAILRSLATGGGVIALSIGIATAAVAGPPFTVTVGGHSVDTSYSYTIDNDGTVGLTAGVAMSCADVSSQAIVTIGSANSIPADSPGEWSNCLGPLSINMAVSQEGSWSVTATGYATAGHTPVVVNNIDLRWQDETTSGGVCSFEVTGSVEGTADEATRTITFTGPSTLLTKSVSGCFGLIPNKSQASFAGTFQTENTSNLVIPRTVYDYQAISTDAVSIHAGISYTCSSVSLAGIVYASSTSSKIADLTSSTWASCKFPLNMDMTVQQIGTWEIDAASGPDANGVTQVWVNNIDAHVTDTSSSGGICSYDITGSMPGTFTNSTQTLAINATNLSVTNVSGCFGLVAAPMSLSASFHVTNPTTGADYPVTIS